MADKAIGELEAVKVGALPVAPDIFDDTLIPVEQQGIAKHITGAQWKAYGTAATNEQVELAAQSAKEAKDAAQEAKESQAAAAESADATSKDADKAEMYSGKPPIIQEGNWYTWNADTQKYQDTGEPARGNLMYAAFWLDHEHGDLYMYTDSEYLGPGFQLNGNDLEVVINAGYSA